MRSLILAVGICFLFALVLAVAADDKAADKNGDSKKFNFIDLQPKANQKLKDGFHGGAPANNLAALAAGEQTLEGVKFKIGDGLIQLGSKMLTTRPDKVEGIKVDKKLTRLHILHATSHTTDDDTIIGEYAVNWEDGTSVTIPIVFGEDVRDWWYYEDTPEPSRGKVAWKGDNEEAKSANAKIRLYLTTWENSKPDKKVTTIDFSSTKDTPCAPFCVAMTSEE